MSKSFKSWSIRINKLYSFRHLLSLGLGRLGAAAARPGSGVTMIPCRHAVIESFKPLPVQIDGDAAGHARRLEVTANCAHLHLIVP